jgi:hypothetical protein
VRYFILTILPLFQNIRCFRLLLTHMYLDSFYYIGSLNLLLTYTHLCFRLLLTLFFKLY